MYTLVDTDVYHTTQPSLTSNTAPHSIAYPSLSPESHIASELNAWNSSGYAVDRKLDPLPTPLSFLDSTLVVPDKENVVLGVPAGSNKLNSTKASDAVDGKGDRWRRSRANGIFRSMRFVARIKG